MADPLTPRLSVVMPSLNQRDFIGDAVRSVMAQEVDGLELVVADGGSDDGTPSALAALAARFAGRLRWSSAPDDGPAGAVHRAIEQARAPVLGWLNADDLYTPGACARALAHFERHPAHRMVYGHGEHVDLHGRPIGRYPTLPPSTPAGLFGDGCFICQPTVFMRRDAYFELGGLDRSLRTAFDFEFWLRAFKAFPGRIGFVDALQAQSRLHAGGITLRMRERVMLEAVSVIRRHLGPAPGHWLLTHLDELCERHPFGAAETPAAAFERLVAQARPDLGPATAEDLLQRLATDLRLRLPEPGMMLGVDADGWAGDVLELRLCQPDPPLAAVVLACGGDRPGGGPLHLDIHASDGSCHEVEIDAPGPFELAIEVPASTRPGDRLVWRIETPEASAEAADPGGGAGERRLAFRVEQCFADRRR